MPQSTEQELFSHIDRALRTVLHVNDRPILPEMTLVGTLGAESIDFLDIVFRLEREDRAQRLDAGRRHAKAPAELLEAAHAARAERARSLPIASA